MLIKHEMDTKKKIVKKKYNIKIDLITKKSYLVTGELTQKTEVKEETNSYLPTSLKS